MILKINLKRKHLVNLSDFLSNHLLLILITGLCLISVWQFVFYYSNGLGLSYNDARSHLDIGRRVVEGIKPGLAQLGSVWLPLPHLLMIPTVWNDFMWHSGLSGALVSMVSFVATAIYVYLILLKLKMATWVRLTGVVVFVANINILYLQSTAMTETLLLATMTAACYYLLLWLQKDRLIDLIQMAGFVMLSTLVRYDGWFLLLVSTLIVVGYSWYKKGLKAAEGALFFYCSMAALGIVLWVLWNLVIFGDPLYFAFGEFSAHAQQAQLDQAGVLVTKGNWLQSIKMYTYALFYNSYGWVVLGGLIGLVTWWTDHKQTLETKLVALALLAPLFFNILALYLGHSVLFIQGISGDTWFNVRYGIMLSTSLAIYWAYLVTRLGRVSWTILASLSFVLVFAFVNHDAVTLDDARVGSSQKNVSEVSDWLRQNATDEKELILISAASHDAIIFSSGLPMKRFIHEGTGDFWDSATSAPDHWVRWIVMRTYDDNDLTYRSIKTADSLQHFRLVKSFPFADIYELSSEYLSQMPSYEQVLKLSRENK